MHIAVHRKHHCKRVAAVAAAAAAAAAGVVAFTTWKMTCNVSPCDLSRLAQFLRGSCGCSPHLSTVSRRPLVRSIVNSDPPSILPPCHVSVRHVTLFMH